MVYKRYGIFKIELLKLLLTAGILFVIVRRTSYWQALGYIFVNIIFLVIILVMSVKKESFGKLFQERFSPNSPAIWWDRVFWYIYQLIYLGIFIIAGIDVGHFNWTTKLHQVFYISGYILYVVSYSFILWAIWTNKYFLNSACIYNEKEYEVIQNGPYNLVRHPGYSGGIFLLAGTATILGSVWALIPAGINIILLILRTSLENKMLKRNLLVYSIYARKVKYRLIPGIW